MDIFKKLKKRKTAFISLIILGILVILALFGNALFGIDPFETNSKIRLLAPGIEHILGTDNLGRDVLARVIYGIRISLAISLVSVAFALIVGTAIGTISGYVGGKVDSVLVLIIEAVCAFPTVLLGLLLATVLGSGMTNIMLAIGISNVPYFARLAISIRGREYIESAVTTGLNHFEIITRYVLPNMSSVIIVQTSLSAASALITESTLSFMGVGVQPPAASLGVLLRDGYDYISKASWLSIFPGIAILLTVIALNFLGDGLRDALDVKIRVDN